MAVLALVAAAGFLCAAPSHHDGDNIHCAGTSSRSMRLYGIDAPEMPGACRPGRDCTPGDPYAARAALQGLTRGRDVRCEQVDTDAYGRRVVRCAADGVDLSCAMVASGAAAQRYGHLDCDSAGSRRGPAPDALAVEAAPRVAPAPAPQSPRRAIADLSEPPQVAPMPTVAASLPWGPLAAWLLAINIATYAAFAIDKHRAQARHGQRTRRIPEATLLMLAGLGGSIGAIAAQQKLRHKTRKQPFATRLLVIAGLHVGIVAGLLLL